jgi:NADPH:quinone reductase-like Zn-dependent oxidoreductase
MVMLSRFSRTNCDFLSLGSQASTVTLNDCLIRRGFDFSLFHPLSLPLTPGFDVVGHVIASGDKVEEFKEGDRVAALVRTGGNARFISVPCDSLVKIPRNIEPAEAAAMVSIFTTAYQALKRITQTGPMFSLQGKKVLILGGMDGVGQALIQMCHKARADIYTTAPTSRHTYIRTFLGVTPLPEDKEAWLPMVQGEIDFVFDGVCEDGLATPYKALKPDGELVCYGHAAMLQEREMGMFGAPMSAHVSNEYVPG